MSSKSKKREPSSDLSRHYRRIGIKAVSSAAARKAPSAETDNLLEQAINCDDAHSAARIIMDALGIETDELANYCLKNWPTDRKQRARTVGNWLQEEAVFLA